MGTWGYGPLDNDKALDSLGFFTTLVEKEGEDTYLDVDPEDMKVRLESLSLKEIQKCVEEEKYGYLKNNRYVIPVFYFEYGAYPKDKAIRDYLYESIDYHECCKGFPKTLVWLKLFKENFDDILSGRATIKQFKLVKLRSSDNDDLVIEGGVVKKYQGSSTEVIIPEGTKEIDRDAFARKSNITKIVLPNSIVKIGENAFGQCKKLASINLPNNLSYIGNYAFSNCSSLANIEPPSSLTYLGSNSFLNCTKIQKIHIPEKITEILPYTFQNCSALKEVTLPKKLLSIGANAFSGCSSLKQIDLPESLLEIGARAFSYCDLSSVYISPKIKAITADQEFPFIGNKSINIIFDEKRTDYSFENGLLYNKDKTILYMNLSNRDEVLTLRDGLKKVCKMAFTEPMNKKIVFSNTIKECEEAFFLTYNLYGSNHEPLLEEIVFNENICFNKTFVVKGTNLYSQNLRKLKKIVLPKNFTYKEEFPFTLLVDICDFSKCESVVYQNNVVMNKDKTIVFAGNRNMEKNLVIPDTVEEIKDAAFMLCHIEEIVWPRNLKKIGELSFSGFAGKELVLPPTLKTIGNKAFIDCKNLEKLTISDGTESIGRYSFSACESLKVVFLPNGLTSIGDGAFSETGIKEITIPGSIKVVPSSAFEMCEKLQKVVFNEGVEKIEKGAFLFSSNIKEVVIPKSMRLIHKDAFEKELRKLIR